MGSLGLEKRTGRAWYARDIDIHVPGDSRGWAVSDETRIYQREQIIEMMAQLGFDFVDSHEHEFIRNSMIVQFGVMDSFPSFIGCDLADVERVHEKGVVYLLPSCEKFLKIYQASSKDSYRNDKNNHKDFAKIAYLKNILEVVD